jgi:hypothetical protein
MEVLDAEIYVEDGEATTGGAIYEKDSHILIYSTHVE